MLAEKMSTALKLLGIDFVMLTSVVNDNIDIPMVSETILDSSFPNIQLVIEGYVPPLRSDRNCYSGGVLIFITEDIAAKMISTTPSNCFQGSFCTIKSS